MAFCIYIFNLCITHKISFKVIFLEHVPAKWPVSDIVASQSTWCSRAVRALPAIPEGPSNHRPHISYISFYISAFTKVLHKMIIYLFIHCTLYVPCTVSKMKYKYIACSKCWIIDDLNWRSLKNLFSPFNTLITLLNPKEAILFYHETKWKMQLLKAVIWSFYAG